MPQEHDVFDVIPETELPDTQNIVPIDSGTYGKVFKIIWGGVVHAMKQVKEKDSGKLFGNELAVMLKLEHPRLVPVIAYDNKNWRFLMPYFAGGNLRNALKNSNEEIAYKFAADIIEGLEYMHKNNVIHRDLKPDNLLMDTDNLDDAHIFITGKNYAKMMVTITYSLND